MLIAIDHEVLCKKHNNRVSARLLQESIARTRHPGRPSELSGREWRRDTEEQIVQNAVSNHDMIAVGGEVTARQWFAWGLILK